MSSVGIIAEFNPFHSGHRLLLNEAKKYGTVVCVLSGNFVQRGDTAIADKRIRAKAALMNGADIVLELPVCWSMSTAQNFALGGISLLDYIGCDTVMFGSECGDADMLCKTAEILQSEKFNDCLSKLNKDGSTFAVARQTAAEMCGGTGGILTGANNNLAIEYIIAASKINKNLQFKTVARKGAPHDSDKSDAEFVSASLLRQKLLAEDYNFCEKYIPENALNLFVPDNISDIRRLDTAILSVLRTRSEKKLSLLPDLSEGIENRLFSAIRLATDLDGLYNSIKSKRYTLSRIRRLVLSAFLGLDNRTFLQKPPYLRVLGFNGRGEALLKQNADKCPVPIVTRTIEAERLDGDAAYVFKTECNATDLYSLSLKNPIPCGLEYTSKIIKTEC